MAQLVPQRHRAAQFRTPRSVSKQDVHPSSQQAFHMTDTASRSHSSSSSAPLQPGFSSAEAEQSVLGALLLDVSRWDDVSSPISLE
jgi:hypothetical protein